MNSVLTYFTTLPVSRLDIVSNRMICWMISCKNFCSWPWHDIGATSLFIYIKDGRKNKIFKFISWRPDRNSCEVPYFQKICTKRYLCIIREVTLICEICVFRNSTSKKWCRDYYVLSFTIWNTCDDIIIIAAALWYVRVLRFVKAVYHKYFRTHSDVFLLLMSTFGSSGCGNHQHISHWWNIFLCFNYMRSACKCNRFWKRGCGRFGISISSMYRWSAEL